MIGKVTINGKDIDFLSQRDAELVGGALQSLGEAIKERDTYKLALEEIRDGEEAGSAGPFEFGKRIAEIRDHAENALKLFDAIERNSEGEPKP